MLPRCLVRVSLAAARAAGSSCSATPAPVARAYSTYRASTRTAIGSRANAAASWSAAASSVLSSSLASSLPLASSAAASSSSGLFFLPHRHATKKAGGSSKNSQDSIGKRLGLKKSAGQTVKVGQILVRQRGKKVHPGRHVGIGRADTLFALTPGTVAFTYLHLDFHRRKKWRKYIHILQAGETLEEVRAESATKSNELRRIVHLHQEGRWLPSTKQQLMLKRKKEANEAKLQQQKAELEKAMQGDEADKLKQHPLFKIRQQMEAAKQQQPTA